jgi:hypothetical protein
VRVSGAFVAKLLVSLFPVLWVSGVLLVRRAFNKNFAVFLKKLVGYGFNFI